MKHAKKMPDPNPTHPMLVFQLADQTYALPVSSIVEVAAIVELTSVPHAPPEVLGYANRHGEALLILDLRQILGYDPCTTTLSTFFIVLEGAQGRLGVVVDTIEQVRYFAADQLTPTTQSSLLTATVSDPTQIVQVLAPEQLLLAYTTKMPAHTQE